MTRNKGKRLNQSVNKALAVLGILQSQNEWCTATEIAKLLGISLGSLYPILRSLELHGYLSRDGSKRYSLGYKLLEHANLILQRNDLYNQAKPHLRKLASTYSVNAHLGIFHARQVLYLHREVGGKNVIIGEIVGWREPAYCTALGKVLLAHLPSHELETYLSQEQFIAFTPNTIIEPRKLRRELEKIRLTGFAINDEEAHEGVVGIAAPVIDFHGQAQAAISISVPKSRFREERDKLVAAVKETAFRISKELGAVGEIRKEVIYSERIGKQ
jgi:DNA-binding IclR family transcriptional regulator